MISALAADSQNDAKSSAGDKHETALSMMHIEQEKLNAKLSEFYDQKSVLDKINPAHSAANVALGSVVRANTLLLFVSAALPKITIDGETVIAVSPQSPLGSELMGREVGDTFNIHGTDYRIHSII